MLALLLLRTDEVAAIHTNTVLNHSCHDVRAQSLTIAHDSILCLLRQVMNEEHTEIDALQLFEELIDVIE